MTSEEKIQIQDERSCFFKAKRKALMTKIQLIREREEAIKKGDLEKMKKIEERIDEIDEKDKNPEEEEERKIWERINAKNKAINYEKELKRGRAKYDDL